jgi:hypothetical protein
VGLRQRCEIRGWLHPTKPASPTSSCSKHNTPPSFRPHAGHASVHSTHGQRLHLPTTLGGIGACRQMNQQIMTDSLPLRPDSCDTSQMKFVSHYLAMVSGQFGELYKIGKRADRWHLKDAILKLIVEALVDAYFFSTIQYCGCRQKYFSWSLHGRGSY